MSKRIFALLLVIVFILPIFPHSNASGETYVAVNNSLLPITDAMPIKSDGIWYVDYRCFTDSELSINGSYNPDSQTLALYNWDYTLAFDLVAGTATNTTTDNTYKQWAFPSNGTIYVPARFVATQFGMTYSYIQSVNVLRIKTTSTLQDSMFAYIARDEIPNLIDRYNASKPQTPETKPSSPSNTEDEDEKETKTAYLTFDVGSETDCAKILSALRRANAKATFFIFGSAISAQDDAIREIATAGHTLGITAFAGAAEFLKSSESMKTDLSATNDLLFQVCYTKSRLVRIPGGSSNLSDEQANALTASGYRYWDSDLNASSMSMRRFRTALDSKGDTVVIHFDASKNSVQNLASILSHLKENHYIITPISLLTTPRNARNDIR